ncbi:MAG: Flavin-dependent oxidoreductase, F420-dependent methylene-tetrahydromethanopterin reductase [Cryobacterium sp.]|jgi:probable non-F420 flavinoid oxidoreductase|nr:Flavin-dependent oxidoreductase, F420-dependent methylene-tetrahydromethanopterin reductase [Cryobacterium sp.]
MTVFGFHASHEQIHPTVLLEAVKRAEQAGFGAAMCSDHLVPWSERQGQSAFAWSWLGAALASTALSFGAVSAPGQRYHPVILAQAIATLGAMFPGRFWSALGSGEAANEHITGERWPRKDIRNARLRESVDVIRALLRGEEVSHDGLVTVDRARLWTLPHEMPLLIAPAVSVETAHWAAEWADGLATIAQPAENLRQMVEAYRSAGGLGPLILQVHVSYAETDAEALAIAHDQWRTNVFSPPLCWDTDSVAAFDEAAKHVSPEHMRSSVFVSADPAAYVRRLQEYADLGFDRVYLHHVGKEQDRFIDTFGERVLPELDATLLDAPARAAGTRARA